MVNETYRLQLDNAQVTAQIANLDARIVEAEIRLRTLQGECDRLRGRREVWAMLLDELMQGAGA